MFRKSYWKKRFAPVLAGALVISSLLVPPGHAFAADPVTSEEQTVSPETPEVKDVTDSTDAATTDANLTTPDSVPDSVSDSVAGTSATDASSGKEAAKQDVKETKEVKAADDAVTDPIPDKTPHLVYGDKSLADEDAFVLLIFGDGFTASEQDSFYTNAQNTADYLMDTSPWDEFKDTIKIYALGVVEGGTGAKKKLMVITNHSYMLWQFRRELIGKLMEDYDVIISTPFVGHEDDFAAMGCTMIETDVDRRGINPKTDMKLYLTYRRLLKEHHPDMVVTYSIKPNVYAGYACRQMRIPYCVNVQGLGTAFQKKGLREIVIRMYKIALKKAKTVYFENKGNAKVFLQEQIIRREQMCLLKGAGVNLKYYTYQKYPENDKVHFLYLGRIMKEKGMDELFYAAKELQRKEVPFVLDLVGFFEDEYKEKIDKLVDAKIAVFHGFQEDPRPYYAMADCVVLPSYHEGMSNVLLEAAATGRPVITSNIPGCKEAVDDDKSGLLCEAEDWNDLYRKMSKIAQMSRIERETMGVCGRDKMAREFDKDKVVKKTIQGIERV